VRCSELLLDLVLPIQALKAHLCSSCAGLRLHDESADGCLGIAPLEVEMVRSERRLQELVAQLDGNWGPEEQQKRRRLSNRAWA